MKGYIKKNCASIIVCQKCNNPGHIKKAVAKHKDCAVAKIQNQLVMMNEKYFLIMELFESLWQINTACSDSSMVRCVDTCMAHTLGGVFNATLKIDQAIVDILEHVVDDGIIGILQLLIGQSFTEQSHIVYYKNGYIICESSKYIARKLCHLDKKKKQNLPKLKITLWVKKATVLPGLLLSGLLL